LGTCQPVTLYTAGAGLTIDALAVGSTEVYFSTSDTALLACPKVGCTVAPRQVAKMSYPIWSVAWLDVGQLVFQSAPAQSTERPALYACPEAGCVLPLTSIISDGLGGFESRLAVDASTVFYNSQNFGLGSFTCTAAGCVAPQNLTLTGAHGFSVDANRVYYVASATSGGVIAYCTRGVTPCTPVTLVTGDQSTVPMTHAYGNRLYWLLPGRAGFGEGRIRSVDMTGTPITDLVNGLNTPTEFVLDGKGAFWLTADPRLQRCAPNGCPGGAQNVTALLSAPHLLAQDDSFVYWAEGAVVRRVAK
jgi:hypothetical protein